MQQRSKSLIWVTPLQRLIQIFDLRIRAIGERSKSLIWVTPLQRPIQISDLANKGYRRAFQIFDLGNATAKLFSTSLSLNQYLRKSTLWGGFFILTDKTYTYNVITEQINPFHVWGKILRVKKLPNRFKKMSLLLEIKKKLVYNKRSM